VDGEIISSISRGLLILIGINKTDTPRDSEVLIKKILGLRLFDAPVLDGPDKAGEAAEAEGSKSRSQSWKKNIVDVEGEILCGEYIFPSPSYNVSGCPDIRLPRRPSG